jgi:hypothetical protein
MTYGLFFAVFGDFYNTFAASKRIVSHEKSVSCFAHPTP